MMASKNRPGQIIELPSTLFTAIASAFLMAMIPAALGDLVGLTVRAPDLVRPAQTANFLVALRSINQMMNV
jgi:hypothetical protein